ncbi:hypothetical protein JTB14_037503 [Gonioctena quinquepunctata]|nr:hypothetical protein JTB14_037503 [Gonioctena quinquepunctata]
MIITNPNSFVNKIKRLNDTDTQFVIGDQLTENSTRITKAFAQYFSSVYGDESTHQFSEPSLLNKQTLNYTHVTIADIEKAFDKLNPKRSSGPDCIPSYIVKACKDLLCPLMIIFQKSLTRQIFSSRLSSYQYGGETTKLK